MGLRATVGEALNGVTPENTNPQEIDGRQKLLEAGFLEETIDELGDDLLDRFEEAYPIYTRSVETNLSLLEALSLQNVEAREASSQQLAQAIERFIEAHPISEEDYGFANRSVAYLREQVAAGVEGAEEALQEKLSQAEDWGKEQVRSALGRFGNIPFIGDWLVETLYGEVEESYESGKQGFFTKILGFFGIGALGGIANEFARRMNEGSSEGYISDTEGERDIEQGAEGNTENTDGDETDTDTLVVESDEPETIEVGDIEHNKRRYFNAGKIFLHQISGEIFEQTNDSDVVYNNLENVELGTIDSAFQSYRDSGSDEAYSLLITELGLQDLPLDKQTVLTTIETIVGDNAESIIKGLINPDIVYELSTNERFIESFGEDFAQSVRGKSLSQLTFHQISICLSFSLPPFIQSSLLGSGALSFQDLFSSENIPTDGISLLSRNTIENIIASFGGSAYIEDPDLFRRDIGYEEMPEEEKDKIDRLINFREVFLRTIIDSERFSLGVTDFESTLMANMSYKKLLPIFLLLEGSTAFDDYSDFEVASIHLWVLNVFPQTGAYGARLALAILEEDYFTEVQQSLIAKHAGRISNSFIRRYLQTIDTAREGLREVARVEIAEGLGIDEDEIPNGVLTGLEITLIGAFVVGGFAVYKLPMPLHFKIVLGGLMHTVGFTALASILYEQGTFEKLLTEMGDSQVTQQVDTFIQEEFDGMTLEDVVNAEENPFVGM